MQAEEPSPRSNPSTARSRTCATSCAAPTAPTCLQYVSELNWILFLHILDEIESDEAEAAYDSKAVNPNAARAEDTRTPDELLDLIEARGREIANALSALRGIG